MEFEEGILQIGAALVLLGIGWMLAQLWGGAQRRARARIQELETELARTHQELEGYRDRVEKHFSQTSELFADLTRQYSAVWDHLAEGARSLCPERWTAIGRGFSEGSALLTHSAPPPGNETDPEASEAPMSEAPRQTPESPEASQESEA